MAQTLKSRFRDFERAMRRRYGRDISTPEARRQAWWHFQLMDHAFLRVVWWNIERIAPGVWRSNQPSPGRVKLYRGMGINSILNLRGETNHSHYLFEREACENQGITLHDVTLSARKLASRETLLELIELMRTAQKPYLFHCKSGSDRAGFAAVLYLAIIEGKPLKEARKQLHWRFLHQSVGETGILDHVFDCYEAETAESGLSLEDWIRTEYDADRLTASYREKSA
ncbi:MAG: tyrosine-protein phosphatase [Pseudomonadota bacterium]